MGKVFTWDDIRYRRVPTKESFTHVAAMLRKRLSAESSVVSALLFGSCVRGDSNIRSDVDCVVIYETRQEVLAMDVMHEIDWAADDLHVPINFTPCDTVLARTRLHHLGNSFVTHLQASMDAGGLIKGNMVDLLAQTKPAEQEIESYITMKMYSLQEGLAQMTTYSEERLVALLKKALEAPTHVARKMLIYEHTLGGDSKTEVLKRYGETMPTNLADQFNYLRSVDSWYSTELEGQLRALNESWYEKTLARLRGELPLVLEFLRSNIRYLDRVH